MSVAGWTIKVPKNTQCPKTLKSDFPRLGSLGHISAVM